MKMSPKHARFVSEYLIDLNATEAAKRAGYTENTARQQGSRLLNMPHIAAAVHAGQQSKLEKLDVTVDQVLSELRAIAFADPRDCFSVKDGVVRVLSLDEMSPAARRAIGEITQTTTESSVDGERVTEKVRTSIKHHSKVQALRMLMDHLGMDAPKRNEHTGPNGAPIQVRSMKDVPTSELLDTLKMLKTLKDTE